MEPVEPGAGYFFASLHPEAGAPPRGKRSRKGKRVSFRSLFPRETAPEVDGHPGVDEGGGTVQSLEALVDGVHEAGERLKEHPTLSQARAYREAVKRLLSYAVKHMLTLEEHTSGSHLVRRKKYALVRVIDEKLERLISGILLQQVDQLSLLARVEEIQGLLVDLFS
ncbi:protein of unknown function DUF327 [Spirochaeta thermophila DSM 6578]|uniref:DUF327 domain-containing protein n=1 Tax=Winmispira thermophila (strain ATCC 700085 / DSM 6578 / Z-1203) TaxID=869211 RepID=G0GD88_WINT7|nr:DUF327 family protein [Spirochaeta thermophila]AEJ62163.1 protein of unknown function DUF327 [Spirochaeta thermophila DSM 6578]